MSRLIRLGMLIGLIMLLLPGCSTDKLMKQEDFSLPQEKAKVTPEKPRPMPQASVPQVKPKVSSALDGKTITLTAKKAAFSDVYAAIASKAGLDLIIDTRLAAGDESAKVTTMAVDKSTAAQLTGTSTTETAAHASITLPPVSISFNHTPLAKALDNLNAALHIYSSVKGGSLYVYGTESRTYHLNFISSQKQSSMSVGGDVLGGTSSGSSGGSSGGSGSGTTPLSGSFSINATRDPATQDIYAQIEEMVKTCRTPYGTYSINRALGFLEINDMRSAVERMDAYIKTLKTYYDAQVVITAKIIEVTLKDQSQYGIDWTHLHSYPGQLFNPVYQTLALSTSNITPALEVTATNAKHGFEAVMNALGEYGDIKVLSNPRIRVTNTQPALISVGSNTSYIQEIKITTTDTDGGSTIITPEVTVGSIFDGIMLGVVPHIDLENNAVNLSITPIKSNIIKIEERTIESNTYSLPTVSLEEVSSQIRVKNGNIIALGGLISKIIKTENKKVPILGDLPYIGYLFKQETKLVQNVELVILLEPVILAP